MPTTTSKRQQYLSSTLRLNHDPFAYAVAELEILANDVDPFFFSYFVDPPHEPNISLLDAIKEPIHSVVYGQVGSGKTTLRYALEAACRVVPDKTLVVSMEIGKNQVGVDSKQSTDAALLEALATDLFVQLVEQHHLFQDILTTELIIELSEFWQSSIPNFRRQLARWLERGEPGGLVGISKWWSVWHRAIVNYTPLTTKRNEFLESIFSIDVSAADERPPTFYTGIKLAQTIGYERIFVLVDVAGKSQNFQKRLHYILKNIFNGTNTPPIFFKGFLPLENKSLIEKSLQPYKQLTSPFLSTIMDWKDSDLLQSIISNRFRSAGSLIKGFESIASQNIVHQINAALNAAADGSPRRLLQLADLLITAHAQRDPADPVITVVDWQRMCQLWSFGHPDPTPILFTKELLRGSL